MRLGFGHLKLAVLALGSLMLGLTGCSGKDATDASVKLGCGVIDGLGGISGDKQPDYIIFGEVIETNEAPGAFAELACRLAEQQPKDRPLWVGLPAHIGEPTDADRAMRQRLRDLVALGAPMILGDAENGHTTGVSRREEAEQRWAETIMASVEAAGAGRALLFVQRRDGMAARMISDDRRLEDFTPMALYLPEGEVVNLEIGQAPGIGAPTIRTYLKMNRGYMGQITLETVTLARKPDPGQKPD